MVQTVDRPITDFFSEQLSNTEVPVNNGTRFPISVRRGFTEILIEPTAALRLHFVPAIKALYFYDSSKALRKERWIDLLADPDRAVINRHVAGTTRKALSGMTSTDFIYVGLLRPVGGLRIDMDGSNVNAINSVLTAAYTQGASFTATAITDTTIASSATLAQDGLITIDTVPITTWTASRLRPILGDDIPTVDERLFWLRLDVSVTITDPTIIAEFIPMIEIGAGAVTDDSQSLMAKASVEYTITVKLPAWVGALELEAQGGGATTAQLTWIKRN